MVRLARTLCVCAPSPPKAQDGEPTILPSWVSGDMCSKSSFVLIRYFTTISASSRRKLRRTGGGYNPRTPMTAEREQAALITVTR